MAISNTYDATFVADESNVVDSVTNWLADRIWAEISNVETEIDTDKIDGDTALVTTAFHYIVTLPNNLKVVVEYSFGDNVRFKAYADTHPVAMIGEKIKYETFGWDFEIIENGYESLNHKFGIIDIINNGVMLDIADCIDRGTYALDINLARDNKNIPSVVVDLIAAIEAKYGAYEN